MSEPFFSVIVPAHNSQMYISRCLHSVKMQTFKDYELIVVCDECEDKTAQVASEYADRIRKETGDEALSFIPCYETILYDDGETCPDEADIVYACRSDLMRYLKKKSRFRYLFKIVKG